MRVRWNRWRTFWTPATVSLVVLIVATPTVSLLGTPGTPTSSTGLEPQPRSGVASGASVSEGRSYALLEPNITWQPVPSDPGTGPGPIEGAAAAWDPRDGYVVVFGGNGSSGPVNTTWTFAPGGWTNRTNTSDAPPAMFGAAMDFDYALDAVVLFGGCGPSECPSASTWLYAGGTWQNVTNRSIDQPPARFDASLAFANDSSDRASVLFGGCRNTACTSRANDTWVLNTTLGWLPGASSTIPPAESGSSLTYDPSLTGLVLFGGCLGSPCGGSNATWLYRGGSWSDLGASIPRPFPPRAPEPAATFDGAFGELVLLAGEPGAPALTWTLACTGSGCQWTNQTLSVGSAELPTAGAALASETGAVPPLLVGGSLGGSSGPGLVNWLLEPTLTIHAEVQPTIAPARSPVEGSSNASGGSPPYRFLWNVGSQGLAAENVTLSFPSAGVYPLLVSVSDQYGVEVQENLTATATGPSLFAVASPGTTDVGVPVRFTASPPEGGTAPYNYTWHWPDGTESFGSNVSRAFESPGPAIVEIVLTDARGVTNQSALTVLVVARPTATITSPLPGTDVGGTVSLSVEVEGGVSPVSYNWTFEGGPASSTGSTVHPRFPSPGRFAVEVVATDSVGATATAWGNVTVNPAVAVTLEGLPPDGPSGLPSRPDGGSVMLQAVPWNGTANYSIAWRVVDPSGVPQDLNGSWANLSLLQVGNYSGQATVTDATGATANVSFVIESVAAPPTPCSCDQPDLLEWEIVIGGVLVFAGAAGVAAAVWSRSRDR
jgi:hypothetical protein